MRVIIVDTTSESDSTGPRVAAALRSLGHELDVLRRPQLSPSAGADLGHRLCDTWRSAGGPDVALTLGWVAGLAAEVAARECPVPVLLRLPRPGRSGDDRITRVERALVRTAPVVLASCPSEAEALVTMGAVRSKIVVLPPMAPLVARELGRSDLDGEPEVITALDDSPADVDAVLLGMAAGRPAVVLDRGILPDLVADGVSGIVVPARGDLAATVRSLRTDQIGREAMGLAAADRVAACFSPEVVTAALARVLVTARRRALQPS